MSVRSVFPSRSASSYSCNTARVDIIAAATGEQAPTCDLAAEAQVDGASEACFKEATSLEKQGGFSTFINILQTLIFHVQSLNSAP